MVEKSKTYTAFAIPGSMTFQSMIDSLLGSKIESYVIGYLEDIILVTDSFEEHVKWLKIVLRKLNKAKLIVNPNKCVFGSHLRRILVGQ